MKLHEVKWSYMTLDEKNKIELGKVGKVYTKIKWVEWVQMS